MNENGEADGGSPSTQLNGEQTGSRKRKPQVVKRVNDGLNVSTTSSSSVNSQLSDFLEERFGLTMMKNEQNGDRSEHKIISEIEKLHQPSAINCEHKFAKVLVHYYVTRTAELKDKANERLLRIFEDAVIDVAPNPPELSSELSSREFDKHLDAINDLMTLIPQKYSLFKLKIMPDTSNWAQGKELLKGKKLFHGCLLSEPAKTLRELMTSYLRRQIVDYVE